MLGWDRVRVSIRVRETGRTSVALAGDVVVDSHYPGGWPVGRQPARDPPSSLPGFTTTTGGLAHDLRHPPAAWRPVLDSARARNQLLVFKVRPAGEASWQARVFSWPWSRWLASWGRAIVTLDHGRAPARPRLELPLRFACTRGGQFLHNRLDDFAGQFKDAGWTETTSRAHIVHARAGDRFEHLTSRHTRLVVLEHAAGRPLVELSPKATYNMLQISAGESERIALCQLFYRAILHDKPLDAALWEAAPDPRLETSSLTLDLFANDEHSLRLRQALYDAADAIETKTTASAKMDESGFESIGFTSGASPHELAETIRDAARAIEFGHEHDGLSAATQVYSTAKNAEDEPDSQPRYANMWLSGRGSRMPLPISTPVRVDEPYDLHFVIDIVERANAVRARLREDALRRYFRDHETLDLDLQLFADPEAIEIEQSAFRFPLKRWGPTDEVYTTCTARQAGLHRLRACIYFRGNLIQSLVMRIGVASERGEESHIDYFGVSDFASLARLTGKTCSIFVNDSDGKHWIGVHAPAPPGQPPSSSLRILGTPPLDGFDAHAKALRDGLGLLEGVTEPFNKATYRFAKPLDATGQLKADKVFVDIARDGRRMFSQLFEDMADEIELDKLESLLAQPDQIISITRLDDKSSMPWAMTYDLPLNPADPNVELCARFRETHPTTARPFAESPGACAERADCPVKGAHALRTVCPFGFWGFRHQIELQLRPAKGDAPLDRDHISVSDKPTAFTAAYDRFTETQTHISAIKQHLDATDPTSNAQQALAGLANGDHNVYYFFCHGEAANTAHTDVALKLADAPTKQLIESASIIVGSEGKQRWKQIAPLVFLNACESLVLDAETISPFLNRFVRLGASALIGTEVKVFTTLATAVGEKLLAAMTDGKSLGEALSALRRDLLSQGNPLGLAYTVFGSAALHFHRAPCPRCEPTGAPP